MVQSALKHLRNALIALFIIICFGTVGYILLEGWNFADALYMVIITITTTGFEEVHPYPLKVSCLH
jgi:voltage-gated potassium channel